MVACRTPAFIPAMIVVFGLIPLIAAAFTYHVDAQNGKDTNPGSREEPFRTILRASLVARPGDTVLIREGIYHEQIIGGASGEEGAPITYEGVDRDRVILQGTVRVTGWKKFGLSWTTDGPRPSTQSNAFVMVDERRMLSAVASPVDVPPGSFSQAQNGKLAVRLWNDENPAEHLVEVYELDVAFNSGDRWGGTAKKWIVLRNLTIEKYGGHGISTDASRPADNAHWELDRITMRLNSNEGVFHCLDDWHVHGCLFTRNRGHGCQIDGARVRFLNNVCTENEWFGPYEDGGCGLLIGPDASAHSCVISNNSFTNNGNRDGYGCGIYLEGRSHSNIIDANFISGNTHAGIGLYGSSRNIISNNVLVDVAPGSDNGDEAAFVVSYSREGAPTVSTGNLIAHNTVWGCPTPMVANLPATHRAADAPNRFVNNLFALCRFLAEVPRSAVVMENNGWFACPAADAAATDLKTSVKRMVQDRGRPSVADVDPRAVIGDNSKLVAPERGDFRPLPGSPVVDAGIPLKEVTSDRDGKPRPLGSAPDLGAYEVGAGGSGEER